MSKYFSEADVDFFRCFTLVDSQGESLFELKPIAYNVGCGIDKSKDKKEAMKNPKSPERIARVEQLRKLYEIMEPTEESPFDTN